MQGSLMFALEKKWWWIIARLRPTFRGSTYE